MTYSSSQTQRHSSEALQNHSSDESLLRGDPQGLPGGVTSTFKLYLEAKNYQPTTVKNYIADTNIYLRATASQNPFSPTVLSAYITNLTKKNNAKRYLASLKKFCQFAADQRLCPPSIFKKSFHSAKSTPLDADRLSNEALLSQFEAHLSRKNRSSSTIKNYLNDLQQYITWLQSQEITNSKSQ